MTPSKFQCLKIANLFSHPIPHNIPVRSALLPGKLGAAFITLETSTSTGKSGFGEICDFSVDSRQIKWIVVTYSMFISNSKYHQ